MQDDPDSSDTHHEGKHSKRALLKGAIARTKNKFKREEKDKDDGFSDDVNDFLSAGRLHTHEDDRLPLAPNLNHSSADLPPRQASPRGIPVPRLDVTRSPRFPGARPIGAQDISDGHDLLQPAQNSRERSRSFSAFKNPHSRPRNLSVSFDNKPPEIIGLGGDESEQPTFEISRRLRAKSLSPMPQQRPGSSNSNTSQGSASVSFRKPVPQHADPFADPTLPRIRLRPLQRVPTGIESIKSPMDHEYELSLGKQTGGHRQDDPREQFKTNLISPKPIHPPVPPPQVHPIAHRPPTPPTVYSQSSVPANYLRPDPVLKQGAVQVVVTDAGLDSPQLPIRQGPNAIPMMPHQYTHHRQQPSLDETETMNQGLNGWL